MDILQSVVLGLIQGITEFVPVSSSGHLGLFRLIFGGGDDFHMFIEFINFGTLLALIIYFRHRIVKIFKDVFKKHNYRLALNIIITCIPAGIAGLLLGDFIEHSDFFGNVFVLAIALGVVGLIMIAIDKLPHLAKISDENHLTKPRALIIGLAQIFALIPGVSRSGSTIVTGRLMGMNNKSSATYSFLASIPLMCGVCLKILISSDGREYLMQNLGTLCLSNLVAFAVGLWVIKIALQYLAKPKSLQTFGYYRVILAMIVIIVALIV